MRINVTRKEKSVNLTSEEKKVINIATLNIISLVNAITTQAEIVMNPIDDEENLGHEVFLSSSVSEENKEFFVQRFSRQMDTFLKMAEIPYESIVEE